MDDRYFHAGTGESSICEADGNDCSPRIEVSKLVDFTKYPEGYRAEIEGISYDNFPEDNTSPGSRFTQCVAEMQLRSRLLCSSCSHQHGLGESEGCQGLRAVYGQVSGCGKIRTGDHIQLRSRRSYDLALCDMERRCSRVHSPRQ
jgi:hypothetical protein